MDKNNSLKNVFNISDEEAGEKKWEEVVECFDWIECKKEEKIIVEGALSDSFFIIVSGMVKIFFSDNVGTETISIVKDGELLGEMGFLFNTTRSASCFSMTDSILIKLTNQNFQKIKEINPLIVIKIYEKIIKTLSTRLKKTTDRLYSRFL